MTRHHRGFSALPRAISPHGSAIKYIAGSGGEMAITGGLVVGVYSEGRVSHVDGG